MELLPCPFCNGEVKWSKYADGKDKFILCECGVEFHDGPILWNRRNGTLIKKRGFIFKFFKFCFYSIIWLMFFVTFAYKTESIHTHKGIRVTNIIKQDNGYKIYGNDGTIKRVKIYTNKEYQIGDVLELTKRQ